MKKIWIYLQLLCFTLTLSACSVASASDIERYAEREFGSAKLIRTEGDGEESRTCYFEDKKYGFEYYVTSYLYDINFDGTSFGESESKSSNFDRSYCAYVSEQVEEDLQALEKEYNVEILTAHEEYSDKDYFSDDVLATIHYLDENTETAPKVSEAVYELYKEYDKRDFWIQNCISVQDAQGEWLGDYKFLDAKFKTPEMIKDDYFIQEGKWRNSKAKYIGKEQKIFKELGISIHSVGQTLGAPEITEDSTVTIYYFEVRGKEFFVVDVWVNGRYYTNYDDVFEE